MSADEEGDAFSFPMKAAYNMAGASADNTDAELHCSMFPDDFCFFCAYERNSSASSNEKDLYGSISDMVKHMSTLKREPSAIAEHVYSAYEQTVRDVVPGKPEWKKESILRHITYNGQFDEIFETSVDNMLRAIIIKQNNSLVDPTTNLINEDNRKAFCETINTLIKWKASQRPGKAGKSQAKPRV